MANKWMKSDCVFTKISYLQRKSELSHEELLLLVDYCNEAQRLDNARFEELKSKEHDRNAWLGGILLATIRCEEITGKRNKSLIAILAKSAQKEVMSNLRTLFELDNVAIKKKLAKDA